MIVYSYIENNLQFLDRNYKSAPTARDASYCSKMAILELCGWMETSMDDTILRASVRLLRNSQNRKFIEDKVKYNYGFEYKRHYKAMIVSLIGISGYEKIENRLNAAIVLNFKSELAVLKKRRNSLAHTYTRGVTIHYDAPSVTIARFQHVASGLKAFDAELRNFIG